MRALLVTCLLGITSLAGAQTLVLISPLPASWGLAEVHQTVETDGNPATIELLIWRYSDYAWRVVSVRPNGTICAAPWFFFGQVSAWPKIRRAGAVDVAMITVQNTVASTSVYAEFSLDHPTVCYP